MASNILFQKFDFPKPEERKATFEDEEKSKVHEPVHEKTNNLGFRPGLTQTGLYSHRRWLEA